MKIFVASIVKNFGDYKLWPLKRIQIAANVYQLCDGLDFCGSSADTNAD